MTRAVRVSVALKKILSGFKRRGPNTRCPSTAHRCPKVVSVEQLSETGYVHRLQLVWSFKGLKYPPSRHAVDIRADGPHREGTRIRFCCGRIFQLVKEVTTALDVDHRTVRGVGVQLKQIQTGYTIEVTPEASDNCLVRSVSTSPLDHNFHGERRI